MQLEDCFDFQRPDDIRLKEEIKQSLDTRNLNLEDVQRFLKFEEQLNNSFTSLLSLESLTEFEQQEVSQIRSLFHSYYAGGKISEGQVKFLLLAPLMKLAGFYQPSIKIILEEISGR